MASRMQTRSMSRALAALPPSCPAPTTAEAQTPSRSDAARARLAARRAAREQRTRRVLLPNLTPAPIVLGAHGLPTDLGAPQTMFSSSDSRRASWDSVTPIPFPALVPANKSASAAAKPRTPRITRVVASGVPFYFGRSGRPQRLVLTHKASGTNVRYLGRSGRPQRLHLTHKASGTNVRQDSLPPAPVLPATPAPATPRTPRTLLHSPVYVPWARWVLLGASPVRPSSSPSSLPNAGNVSPPYFPPSPKGGNPLFVTP